MKLEHESKCPVCGCGEHAVAFEATDNNCGFDGVFTYARCAACGLLYQHPIPGLEEMRAYYPASRAAAGKNPESDIESRILNPANRFRAGFIARLIARHQAGNVLFDIGCGRGFFLECMRRQGWLVRGMDADAEQVAFAREKLGLHNVKHGTWPIGAPSDAAAASVVTMNHVIEHIPNPVEALMAVKSVLLENGLLAIETPNERSWPARLFGRHWVTLDAPRHVTLFSSATLEDCVRRAGFDVLETVDYSPSTMEYSESLRYFLRHHGVWRKRAEGSAKGGSDAPCGCEAAAGRDVSHSGRSAMKKRALDFERGFYSVLNNAARLRGAGCNLLLAARPAAGCNSESNG